MNIILFYVCLFLCYVKKEKANKQKTVKKNKNKKTPNQYLIGPMSCYTES